MIEKVWAIARTEEVQARNGNYYLRVTVNGDDGREHNSNVWERTMWPIFKQNKYVQVKLEKPPGKTSWEVMSAVGVADGLKPPVNPNSTPQATEMQTAADNTREAMKPPIDPRQQDIHEQVALKEIGEGWRCGSLSENTPEDNALIKWYKNWLYKATDIQVEHK